MCDCMRGYGTNQESGEEGERDTGQDLILPKRKSENMAM